MANNKSNIFHAFCPAPAGLGWVGKTDQEFEQLEAETTRQILLNNRIANALKLLKMDTQTFITIPKTEWEELQQTIKFIATEITALRDKKNKEFLTFKEAEALLKCSRNTLQRYIDIGKIDPVIRHCGSYKKYLFKKADLLYFLQHNRR